MPTILDISGCGMKTPRCGWMWVWCRDLPAQKALRVFRARWDRKGRLDQWERRGLLVQPVRKVRRA